MRIKIEVTADNGDVYGGEFELAKLAGKGKGTKVKVVASPAPAKENKRVSCPGAIEILWKEGHFKKPLLLSSVLETLDGRGYNFPKNTLNMALKTMKFLTRRGSTGSYTWVQKFPYAG